MQMHLPVPPANNDVIMYHTKHQLSSSSSPTTSTASSPSAPRKPGQFANVSGCPWLQNKSPRKSRKRLQVAYPVFEQFSEEVTDGFWKQFFLSIAYGKLPRGFAIRDEVYYRRGGKCHKIPMTEAVDKVIEFFQKHGGFHSTSASSSSSSSMSGVSGSSSDLFSGDSTSSSFTRSGSSLTLSSMDTNSSHVTVASTGISSAAVSSLAPVNWSRLQKKQKDMLLECFAEDCTAKFGYGFGEYQQLLQLLNISQILLLLDDRVRMNAGRISSIQGLSLDPKRKKFFFHKTSSGPSATVLSSSVPGVPSRTTQHAHRGEETSAGRRLFKDYESWLEEFARKKDERQKTFGDSRIQHRPHDKGERLHVSASTLSRTTPTHTTPLGTQLSESGSSSCLETLWSNVMQEMRRVNTP